MRHLILSDIHANITALDAALEAANGKWEKVVCLGDVVGYGPDPNEVINRIRSLRAITIRGNHDKASSGLADADDFNPVARNVALWTRSQLSPENKEWLERLPVGPVSVDGFTIAHGACRDEDEYVFAPAQALDSLLDARSPVTFFGHTHLQGGFATNGDDWFKLVPDYATRDEAEEYEVQLREGVRYLINPGSVGQPRDGDWRSAFAIYDDVRRMVTFYRVPYDVRQAQLRIVRAGLPDRLATRLRDGR